MKLGEDLVVRGGISARLHRGMTESSTSPKAGVWDSSRSESTLTSCCRPPSARKRRPVSFLAAWTPFAPICAIKVTPHSRITHVVLVNGSDIDAKNPSLWEATRRIPTTAGSARSACVLYLASMLREHSMKLTPSLTTSTLRCCQGADSQRYRCAIPSGEPGRAAGTPACSVPGRPRYKQPWPVPAMAAGGQRSATSSTKQTSSTTSMLTV